MNNKFGIIIYISTILVLLFYTTNIFSQSNFGIRAGANFATYSGKNTIDNSKAKPGIFAGVMFEIPLRYMEVLQVGGFLSQQGTRSEIEKFNYGHKNYYRQEIKVNYLVVPLTWKQIWGDVYTKIGPYGAIATSAEYKWFERKEYPDSIYEASGVQASFVRSLRQYDLGFTLGVGYQTPISEKVDVFLDFTYSLGLFSIYNYTDKPNPVMRNQAITITTGMVFTNKQKRYAPKRRR